jgi:hypothetical protein
VIAESEIRAEVESCLTLARRVEVQVASGERVVAARAAVELARAYDAILYNIRLASLSVEEQQFVRDRLAPVLKLLRRYRLR